MVVSGREDSSSRFYTTQIGASLSFIPLIKLLHLCNRAFTGPKSFFEKWSSMTDKKSAMEMFHFRAFFVGTRGSAPPLGSTSSSG